MKDQIPKEQFFKKIETSVTASPADVIMMLLTFSITYNLKFAAVESLFKLINAIFDVPVVPDTKYLLKLLFNPNYEATFHFTCHDCGAYVCQFNPAADKPRIVTCGECEALVDTSALNGTNTFAIWDISEDVRKLLEANSEYYNDVVSNRIPEDETISDIYDGIRYRRFVQSLPERDRKNYVTSMLNSDGSPVFENSMFSIWPVQDMLNELPMEIRLKNTIVHGLWFGNSKPNMQVFLKPIVDNLIELNKNGIECNIAGETRRIKMYTICCCVDSAARPLMQGLSQHNGYSSCSWCYHPGEWSTEHRSMKFPATEHYPLRTKDEAVNDIAQAVQTGKRVNGFKPERSPLNDLEEFDIINGFVVDFMHNSLLGVAKTFAKYWTSSGNDYSLSARDIRLIDKMLINLTPHTQIGRLSRPIKFMKSWKSREWENWLLYFSGPILSELLPDRYVIHWKKFVEALHILLQQKISYQDVELADELLHSFVFDCEQLYGRKAMTFNIHQLLHLATSVLEWGPLFCHSGYPFENGNGKLVSVIHAVNGAILQVQRHMQFNKTLTHLEHLKSDQKTALPVKMFLRHVRKKTVKHTFKTENCRFIGKSFVPNKQIVENCNMSLKNTEGFRKIIVNGCVYTSCKKKNKRSNNSYAMLKNGTFFQIEDILLDKQAKIEIIVGKIVRTKEVENICKQTRLIEMINDVRVCQISEIESPCNVINVNADSYICPVPNTYHFS